ncbi:MAG: hypothetical protein ABIA04_16420 [Pseudomonadota bacterium]
MIVLKFKMIFIKKLFFLAILVCLFTLILFGDSLFAVSKRQEYIARLKLSTLTQLDNALGMIRNPSSIKAQIISKEIVRRYKEAEYVERQSIERVLLKHINSMSPAAFLDVAHELPQSPKVAERCLEIIEGRWNSITAEKAYAAVVLLQRLSLTMNKARKERLAKALLEPGLLEYILKININPSRVKDSKIDVFGEHRVGFRVLKELSILAAEAVYVLDPGNKSIADLSRLPKDTHTVVDKVYSDCFQSVRAKYSFKAAFTMNPADTGMIAVPLPMRERPIEQERLPDPISLDPVIEKPGIIGVPVTEDTAPIGLDFSDANKPRSTPTVAGKTVQYASGTLMGGATFLVGDVGSELILAAIEGGNWSRLEHLHILNILKSYAGLTLGHGAGLASVKGLEASYIKLSGNALRKITPGPLPVNANIGFGRLALNRGVPLFFALKAQEIIMTGELTFGVHDALTMANILTAEASVRAIIALLRQGTRLVNSGSKLANIVSLENPWLALSAIAAREIFVFTIIKALAMAEDEAILSMYKLEAKTKLAFNMLNLDIMLKKAHQGTDFISLKDYENALSKLVQSFNDVIEIHSPYLKIAMAASGRIEAACEDAPCDDSFQKDYSLDVKDRYNMLLDYTKCENEKVNVNRWYEDAAFDLEESLIYTDDHSSFEDLAIAELDLDFIASLESSEDKTYVLDLMKLLEFYSDENITGLMELGHTYLSMQDYVSEIIGSLASTKEGLMLQMFEYLISREAFLASLI